MLVLASQSPRRQEILRNAGIDYIVRASGVDEAALEGETPEQHVRRLAVAKAMSVTCAEDEVVLGADTTVTIDGQILGKPESPEEAGRMLRLLAGQEHCVITGICLRSGGSLVIDSECTRVRFVAMTEEEIAACVASPEPYDKAGGYAIQGLASRFIDRIEGCYCNVVGLPVALVSKHLRRMGHL